MVEAEYFLFCESKALADNGLLSLQNIFERVYADNFPAAHHPFVAVFRLVPTDNALVDQAMAIKIISILDGKEISGVKATIKVAVELGNGFVPSIDLSQFIFPEPGDYDFRLFVDDKELASRNLQVRNSSELTEK